TPTLKASSPSFAAPTSSPSASCTRSGNTASDASPAGARDTVESFTAVPPLIFGGSPRTLPTGADEAGGTAVKFYELRDNLYDRPQTVSLYLKSLGLLAQFFKLATSAERLAFGVLLLSLCGGRVLLGGLLFRVGLLELSPDHVGLAQL